MEELRVLLLQGWHLVNLLMLRELFGLALLDLAYAAGSSNHFRATGLFLRSFHQSLNLYLKN